MAALTVAAADYGKAAVTLTASTEDVLTFTGGTRRVRIANTHATAPLYVNADQAVETAITVAGDNTKAVKAGEVREFRIVDSGRAVKGTTVRVISGSAATYSIEKV